jgi:hypothetical protein
VDGVPKRNVQKEAKKYFNHDWRKNMKSLLSIMTLSLGLMATTAQASLINRGGGMIYDTDLNITWLADANYAMTSGYDADGLMTWSDAVTWAGNLSYGGYTDWRLPTSDTCSGYKCTGSELGHLYYIELSGAARQPMNTAYDTNYYLFQNIQPAAYWSGTELAPNAGSAWIFSFGGGLQNLSDDIVRPYAWAVRPGDVAAVPLPAAVWLFGSGLLGLIGVARRRRPPSAVT